MKKILFMSVFSVLALSGKLVVAAEVTGTGHVSARIVDPLSVTETAELNFGAILQGANTITVSPAGTRTAVDSSKLVGKGYGSTKAGKWKITGPVGARPSVKIQESSVTLENSSGASMIVNNFVTDAEDSFDEIEGSGSGTGEVEFKVGANLTVADNQEPGNYSGTYTVTVSY